MFQFFQQANNQQTSVGLIGGMVVGFSTGAGVVFLPSPSPLHGLPGLAMCKAMWGNAGGLGFVLGFVGGYMLNAGNRLTSSSSPTLHK